MKISHTHIKKKEVERKEEGGRDEKPEGRERVAPACVLTSNFVHLRYLGTPFVYWSSTESPAFST